MVIIKTRCKTTGQELGQHVGQITYRANLVKRKHRDDTPAECPDGTEAGDKANLPGSSPSSAADVLAITIRNIFLSFIFKCFLFIFTSLFIVEAKRQKAKQRQFPSVASLPKCSSTGWAGARARSPGLNPGG